MASSAIAYISLDSGGGGADLGLRLALPGAKCVCYVEREISAVAVLVKGMEAGLLDEAPIWSDHNTIDARAWRGRVAGVIGGIPCQPFSAAGKRLGAGDERNGWPAAARVVFEAQPAFCFFENVPSADFLWYYWTEIRPQLRAMEYEVTEGIFSAAEVGASHLRERFFWLAYSNGAGRQQVTGSAYGDEAADEGRAAEQHHKPASRGPGLADAINGAGSAESELEPEERAAKPRLGGNAVADVIGSGHGRRTPEPGERESGGAAAEGAGDGQCESEDERDERSGEAWRRRAGPENASRDLGNAERSRLQGSGLAVTSGRAFPPGPADRDGWREWLREWPGTEPALRRDADGLANRSDRLRVLGNGQVPVVAAHAFLSLARKLGCQI